MISPISSRNIVPSPASSKRPFRDEAAPLKAPLVWPKSSDSSRDSEMAPQLIATNWHLARGPELCRALAASSLPVPVSPVISTGTSICAKCCMEVIISSITGVDEIIMFVSEGEDGVVAGVFVCLCCADLDARIRSAVFIILNRVSRGISAEIRSSKSSRP